MSTVLPFSRLFSFIVLFGCLAIVNAQVPGYLDYSTGRADEPDLVRVSWQPADAAEWQVRNGDRLDYMGLKAGIRSALFNPAGKDRLTFQVIPGAGHSLEMLIQIDQWNPGEKLELVDLKSDSVLFSLVDPAGRAILTPVFYPDQTYWRWIRNSTDAAFAEFTFDLLFFHPDQRDARDIGFGTALPCHPNAACRTDSMFRSLANSAVRIRMVMEEGIGWCTGALVNNTLQDKKPYLLTAYHCQYDFTPRYDLWRFDFSYASPDCATPSQEPDYFSLTGCSLKAGGQASDFLLVLLDQPVPANVPATFAGWNRSDTDVPDTSYLIHHPSADIRKSSTAGMNTTIHPNLISWTEGFTTPAHHHFRVRFTEGGHEPGSSGGPLFNQDGLLVGQLHGGMAGCAAASNTYVGRLSKSWAPGAAPGERLRDWLDPQASGVMNLGGLSNIDPADIVDIQGRVTDPGGRPVRNARIRVTGDVEQTLVTDADGTFRLAAVNRNGSYNLIPEKTENPANGLNALDLVGIQKHLLAKDTFDFPWQYIAGDATNGNTLTVGDIVLIQRLLLGKINVFPSSPAWRFDPPSRQIGNLPPGSPTEVQFMAIKIGDINNSANPQQ